MVTDDPGRERRVSAPRAPIAIGAHVSALMPSPTDSNTAYMQQGSSSVCSLLPTERRRGSRRAGAAGWWAEGKFTSLKRLSPVDGTATYQTSPPTSDGLVPTDGRAPTKPRNRAIPRQGLVSKP